MQPVTTRTPLPIGAVARELGVSVDTVREWERQGRITSFRTVGNQRRFEQDAIDALKASFTDTPADAGPSPSPGDGPAADAA